MSMNCFDSGMFLRDMEKVAAFLEDGINIKGYVFKMDYILQKIKSNYCISFHLELSIFIPF